MNEIDFTDIEHFYEATILPTYPYDFKDIVWISHDKIGDDTFAHYFSVNNERYTLVFEDFPSQPHFIADDSVFIPAPGYEHGRVTHPQVKNVVETEYVENITGTFSLYKDD